MNPAADSASKRPSARAAIEACRSRGARAFIPFLTAGYPSWEVTAQAIGILADAGATALELGVPFSDPLADGPTIQLSSQRALEAGVTLDEILTRLEGEPALRRLPIVLMSYANPIVLYGVDRFCARAKDAQVAGVLVSDLPPEELPDLWSATKQSGLESVVLVAPTTRAERVPVLARAADGYVYCVTRTGVTGKGGSFAGNLAEQVRSVRAHTRVPVVAGFGVRTPEDAARLGAEFDGVIVGARIIEIVGRGDAAAMDELRSFASGVVRALAP